MSSELPLQSMPVILAWLAGCLFLAVPGALVRGAWIDGPWYERVAASVLWGVLLGSLLSTVTGNLGLPLTPAGYAAVALPLSVVSAVFLRPAHGRPGSDPGRAAGLLTAVSVIGLAGVLLAGFRSLVVPPHIHDAGNHAFMTWRVVEAASVSAGRVWSGSYGSPAAGYPLGLHAVSALIARTAGVAPYISPWFLSVFLVILSPVPWVRLWRRMGFPSTAAAAAGLLILANSGFPLGVFGWGGFTTLVGYALIPLAVEELMGLHAEQTARRALPAGMALGGLLWIHPLSFLAAVILAVVAVVRTRSPRWSPTAWLLAAGLVGVTVMPDLWAMTGDFAGHRLGAVTLPHIPVGKGLVIYLRTVVGEDVFIPLMAGALVSGWVVLGRRDIATASLVLGGLAVWVGASADPVSRWLSAPFYYNPHRIHALQMMLVPPLIMAAWLEERRAPRLGRRFGPRLGGALVLATLVVGVAGVPGGLARGRRAAPVTVEDFHLARRLSEVVEEGAWIGNFRNDGTSWFLHLADLPVIRPTSSWRLSGGSHDAPLAAMDGLGRDPGRALDDLRAGGVRYLLVSDQGLPGRVNPVGIAALRMHPRLEVVDESPTTACFRILGPPPASEGR